MGLTEAVILVVVLAVLLIAALAFTMSRTKLLRPHRPRGGRPSARLRWRGRRDRTAER